MKFQLIPLLQRAWHLRQATRYNFIIISITMSSNTETNNLEDIVRELMEMKQAAGVAAARISNLEEALGAEPGQVCPVKEVKVCAFGIMRVGFGVGEP